jgi:GT2 family glycosyltransferase
MDFVETALKIGHGNWTYQHHPENIPLPKVYNNVVAHARNEELIIFLDQDSQFDQEYIKEVTESALTYPGINLFAPLVYARNRLVSPGHFQYFKGRYWSKPKKGLTCAKGNIALMSGLAVRTSYLRSFGGFDERLRLYGVDTNLLLRYAKSNKQFFVLGALFNHDLSDFNKEPHDVKLKRFEDFDHASRINAELFSLPVQILTAFFLWYRRLGLKACRS